MVHRRHSRTVATAVVSSSPGLSTTPRGIRRISRFKMRNPRKRKASKRTASRQVKDEKARYERCRRRRWGLVKKAREYSALFGAEVNILVKDEHNAHYFMSHDRWISAPQDVVKSEGPLGHHQC